MTDLEAFICIPNLKWAWQAIFKLYPLNFEKLDIFEDVQIIFIQFLAISIRHDCARNLKSIPVHVSIVSGYSKLSRELYKKGAKKG